jgi:multicomponent Na+:H+ antiporter subunit G
MEEVVAVLADLLVVIGLLVTTLGVVGLVRMPDVYTELHSASKAVFLGIIAFLIASLASLDLAIASKAILTATFILLTTPVAAHVIALAAFRRQEPMLTPGAIDESGSELAMHGDGAP